MLLDRMDCIAIHDALGIGQNQRQKVFLAQIFAMQSISEEYLVSHIALQYVLDQSKQYSICLQHAEDEAFGLQTMCGWNPYRLMIELLAKPVIDQSSLRVVKLTGYERDLADFFIRRRLANPRSLLGRLSTRW